MPATKSEISEFRENIIELHNKIIDRSGGERGIRDEGGLDHGIYMLISYFDTHKDKPVEIAAKIFDIFATRHYFVDGN